MKMCTILNCEKRQFSNGMCSAHHSRWRRHGNPLLGRTTPGEPEQYYRQVVLAFGGDGCLTWPYRRNSSGYALLWRDGRMMGVSRLVCEASCGAPPGPLHDAAHSCGNGHLACVSKKHLSWKTKTANQADRLLHGTHSRGERNGAAKLTESDVLSIRDKGIGETQSQLAARFGVSPQTISDIQREKKWAWLALKRAEA